jgi:hypothetical protein
MGPPEKQELWRVLVKLVILFEILLLSVVIRALLKERSPYLKRLMNIAIFLLKIINTSVIFHIFHLIVSCIYFSTFIFSKYFLLITKK